MADHDGMYGYASHAQAVSAAKSDGAGRVPYRVWRCPECRDWHAAPWVRDDSQYVRDVAEHEEQPFE